MVTGTAGEARNAFMVVIGVVGYGYRWLVRGIGCGRYGCTGSGGTWTIVEKIILFFLSHEPYWKKKIFGL